MHLRPKILSSGKPIRSPGAIASGSQRLIAFAHDNCISIIEPNSIIVIQSLNLHVLPVTQLTWAPDSYDHDSKNSYTHRLASADLSGRIIIWNVSTGIPLAEASEPNTEVIDMHWIPDQDMSRDLLLILHSDNRLILWNAQTCTPIWKKTYTHDVNSISFDPFSSNNLILHGTNKLFLVNDLSWHSSPEAPEKQFFISDSSLKNNDLDAARWGFSKSIKATAKAVIGKGLIKLTNSQKNYKKLPANRQNAVSETPIQILYHGFRKHHIIFVYPREIFFYDLILSQYVGDIHLDQTSASFAQVYSCRQADALICLHQNGTISLDYYHPPSTLEFTQSLADGTNFSQSSTDLNYFFLCESKSLRRGRNFSVVAMSVNPTTELDITIATSDGRLQLLSIESEVPSDDGWPEWTLMDIMKSLDDEQLKDGSTPLRIRFKGFYSGGSPSPTVCCVCPTHFLFPLSEKIKHESLIAVGTSRGSVQIWELHTSKIWREYMLVNGPVHDLAWGTLPSPDNKAEQGSLTLFVQSCQISPDSTGGNHGAPSSDNIPSTNGIVPSGVRNVVMRIDLLTGQQNQVPTQNLDTKGLHLLKTAMQQPSSIKPSKWLNVASQMTEHAVACITPIRSIKVSNLGQYLAILYENWPLEIWDARKLVLLKLFTQQSYRPVALTWSNVSVTSLASSPGGNTGGGDQSYSPNGVASTQESYNRETFILCTSPITLQLYTMEGANVDTMPISSIIVQSLPHHSRNGITCASWRSPMIAFGMADGCVAVRNLSTKETLSRYMGVLVADSNFGDAPSTAISDAGGFSSKMKGDFLNANRDVNSPSYVKKVEFMFSGGSSCRLLTLCNGGIAVWEPKQMVLLCAARFGTSPQRVLIDAAWTNAVLSPAHPSPTCVLLALDGSLRLAAAGSAACNRFLVDPNANTSSDADDSLEVSDEYLPISQFEFNSSISNDVDWNSFLYLPSLLPANIALTIRYLLQHQPWHSKSNSTDLEKISQANGEGDGGSKKGEESSKENGSKSNNIVLLCPPLGPNFANVQSTVDRFFAEFRNAKHLSAPFKSSQLTIVERCLLTAQLFGDTYETAFWRVVAYQLLASGDEGRREKLSSRWKRFGLTDLVWDELTEEASYRSALVERVNRLVHNNTPEQSKLCIQFLLLLGYEKESIKHLAETPTSSDSYSFNIHRACLLASQSYIRDLEAAAGEANEVVSAARLNYTSSVKLLAANLISNNHLHDGVEMLCMLGMHLEACRYLETYNEWGTAVWLAKCMLSKEECEGVLRRWATYLATTANQKTLAILVLAYLGQHSAVLNLLHSLRQYQLAARYLEACQECGAVLSDLESENLHSKVFLEFARTLISMGQRDSALYYAGLAGDLGKTLRDEIDFLLN
nr:transmembrane protein 180 [Hymenolepis microstoma]